MIYVKIYIYFHLISLDLNYYEKFGNKIEIHLLNVRL